MTRDCRFCICVPCFPWEEGVHNFRHSGNEDACTCTRCTHDRPLYAERAPATTRPLSAPA